MEPYESLANAIILRAVEDYRAARMKLKLNPEYGPALELAKDCESFFLSEWFSLLTKVDGAVLLKRLQEEAE